MKYDILLPVFEMEVSIFIMNKFVLSLFSISILLGSCKKEKTAAIITDKLIATPTVGTSSGDFFNFEINDGVNSSIFSNWQSSDSTMDFSFNGNDSRLHLTSDYFSNKDIINVTNDQVELSIDGVNFNVGYVINGDSAIFSYGGVNTIVHLTANNIGRIRDYFQGNEDVKPAWAQIVFIVAVVISRVVDVYCDEKQINEQNALASANCKLIYLHSCGAICKKW